MHILSLTLVIGGFYYGLTAPAPDCANTVFNVFASGKKQARNDVDDKTNLKVAFSVSTKNSDTGGTTYSTVKFDETVSNRQNAFNLATNVFTAPVSGVYLFSFMSRPNGNNVIVYFNVNNKRRFMTILSPSGSTGGFSNVVELDAGAKVFLSLHTNNKLYGCNPSCTIFSGYLLHSQKSL